MRFALASFLVSLVTLLVHGCDRVHPAREALKSELTGDVPHWVGAEKLSPAAAPGARLFATSGCTACHRYLEAGSSNLGAPNLTSEGLRSRGVSWQIRHLRCPACLVAGSPMPRFAVLGPARLHDLAVFLESSKGKR